MSLVDLNYNFEFDWFVDLSDNKLSDNNLASELLGNRSFFKPITIEEIVIFMITQDIDIESNTRREIPCLREPMNYSLCHAFTLCCL